MDRPALAASAPAGPALVGPDDPWVIIYTSGTTGRPKGVLVTHAGSEATMLAALMSSRVTRDSVCLTALPVWHVAGLNLYANPALFAGGTVLVMQAFDPGLALELLTRAEEPVTHFTGFRPTTSSCRPGPGGPRRSSPRSWRRSAVRRSRPRSLRTGRGAG